MKNGNLLKSMAFSALLTSMATGGFAQVFATQLLVGGTDFDPIASAEGKAFISADEIKMTGALGGTLTLTGVQPESSDLGYDTTGKTATSNFHEGEFMAITSNPYMLDSLHYINDETKDWGVVWSRVNGTSSKTILSYKVNGLVPGSNVKLEIDFRSVIDTVSANYKDLKCLGSNFVQAKVAEQPDRYNLTAGKDFGFIKHGGQIATYSSTNGVVSYDGSYFVNVNLTSQFMNSNCASIEILGIKVYGEIEPKISIIDDNNCAGEIATVEATSQYNGATYQWYINGKAANGETGSSFSFETADEETYRVYQEVTVDGVKYKSNELAIHAEKCCELSDKNGESIALSRKVIFKEDFGKFDLSDPTGTTYKVWDYSDIANPVQVTKKTTTPFRYKLDKDPLGCEYQGEGPLVDGEYTVAGVLTGYGDPYNSMEGARLEWSADLHGIKLDEGIHFDHSGKPEGCCLLVNCKDKTAGQNIYERDITNLCENRQLFFECYISIFTSSAAGAYVPVDVLVRLTEIGNESNVVESRATQTLPSKGGTGDWVKISGVLYIEKGEGVKIEVVNMNNSDQNGNDLAIDDIKISACAVPSLQTSFAMSYIDWNTDPKSDLMFGVNPTDMLVNYFGADNIRYLYQWTSTPEDKTSWKRISEPTKGTTMNIADVFSEHLNKSEKDSLYTLYFRAIAGTEAILSLNDEYYNPNDPCATYSISEPKKYSIFVISSDDCVKPEAPKAESVNYEVNGKKEILTTEKFTQTLRQEFSLVWFTSDDPEVEPNSKGTKIVEIDRSVVTTTPYVFYIAYYNGECYSDRAKVEVSVLPVSGVESIASDNDEIINVYSISGALIRSNVKRSEALKGLMPGSYLIGNEKGVIK